jgi:hypothetical protein
MSACFLVHCGENCVSRARQDAIGSDQAYASFARVQERKKKVEEESYALAFVRGISNKKKRVKGWGLAKE